MEAQADISSARRISVVGSTGSGKTTLARDLSHRLGLPFHELDALRGSEGFADAVGALVATDGWIIDGHYRDVRHAIWRRSDLVVHLNYSPLLILTRLVSRFLGKRRGSDTSKGSGGSASWARRFARLAKTIRERREYAKIFSGPEFAGLTVIELKSPRATRDWLDDLDAPADASAAAASV